MTFMAWTFALPFGISLSRVTVLESCSAQTKLGMSLKEEKINCQIGQKIEEMVFFSPAREMFYLK